MPALIPTAPNGNGPTHTHAGGVPDATPNGVGVAGKAKSNGAAMSKNQLRRMKLKAKKQEQRARGGTETGTETEGETDGGASEVAQSESESEAAAPIDLTEYDAPDLSDPAFAAFANILQKFQQPAEEADGAVDDGPQKAEVIYSDEEDDDEEEGEQARAAYEQMSKKKLKKLSRLSVAELKQLVAKPEVVEWYDCSARDPRLLVSMKSYRNTVPVPIHWSAKREYLAGKRGIEKPPFQLPPWIADTGIADQRDAIKEKESNMTLKQKTRERVQPKMGKIDIDYQKLHDAFFKFQSKPSMSRFGEAYYEGKELETDLRMKKPGEISEELKEALSIPPLAPPPWLIAMQRFGPPPSYPNMRIRGLNAPIPEGAQWGFHPGGWGRPPLDEYSRPLYGDPFGLLGNPDDAHTEDIQRELWGQLEPEEEESEEEEEEEEEEEDIIDSGHEPAEGLQTPSGMATPSGINSVISTVPGGLETPDFMELRKSHRPSASEVESNAGGPPRELYQVVPERQATSRGFMGSSTAYDVSAVSGPASGGPRVLGQEDRGNKRKAGADISVNPEDLENMSQAELQAQYDASRTSTGRVHVPGADVDRSQFADVIEEQSAKRSKTADKDRERRREREKEKFKF